MQTSNNDSRPAGVRTRASRTALVATASLLIMAMSVVPASAGTENYIAVINGAQEVGPTMSSSVGNAFLTYDSASKMLCYAISYTGLDGDETAAHFHGPSSAGENNAVLFNINAISGVGSPKADCVGPFGARAQAALRQGKIYINVHSSLYPGGEIRGQVIPVKGN